MKTTKSGAPAVPKFLWKLLAETELEFAGELLDALERVEPEVQTPMAIALVNIAARHIDLAKAIDRLSASTKRGRPKTIRKHPNALAAAAGIPAPPPARAKPGRPTKAGPEFDLVAFEVVQRRLAKIALGRTTKPTVKAAIDSLNRECARDLGRRETTFVNEEYASLRASYQRGKRMNAKFKIPIN